LNTASKKPGLIAETPIGVEAGRLRDRIDAYIVKTSWNKTGLRYGHPQTPFEPCLYPTGQRIRAVGAEFSHFGGDGLGAKCRISPENVVVHHFFSSFAHLESPSRFRVDDFAIGGE
jgi:hypothetical protein